jgi:hypothetical protein
MREILYRLIVVLIRFSSYIFVVAGSDVVDDYVDLL